MQGGNIDKIAEGVSGLAKEAGDKVRRTAYAVAGRLEQQAADPKTVVGGAADIVKKAVARGRDLHHFVHEKGGYSAVVEKAADRIADRVGLTIDAIVDRYGRFEDKFFTGGQYDPVKGRRILEDTAAATKMYGAKAVTTLKGLASSGARALREDFRAMVPSPGELQASGIGAKYEGILFREHLQQCLSFYERARKRMPGGLRVRAEVLDDIKAYAIGTRRELLEHYRAQGPTSEAKHAVAAQYIR